MFIDEYDEERARREIYEDGYEDGFETGVQRGQLTVLWNAVQENDITLEEAASWMNMSVEEFQREAEEAATNPRAYVERKRRELPV